MCVCAVGNGGLHTERSGGHDALIAAGRWFHPFSINAELYYITHNALGDGGCWDEAKRGGDGVVLMHCSTSLVKS